MSNSRRQGPRSGITFGPPPAVDAEQPIRPHLIPKEWLPDYIYGLHEPGGEHLMADAARIGWVLNLAAIGLDGKGGNADFSNLAGQGFGVVTRLNNGYGSVGTIPTTDKYGEFAQAAARFVARSRGCNIWIVGNEPNHAQERPYGQVILPSEYANAYQMTRAAIRSLPDHENDLVLVAGSAPWNATTTYASNVKGDWIRYFIDVMENLADDEVDGFAIHTYTHDLNPQQITGDFFHREFGYTHLRNEFRTYRDYMNAIPDRFRHTPVLITETDPTTRHQGWNPGVNVGWVQAAYKDIAEWNADRNHQPVQALILYRWPVVNDQPEWSISDRPGIIEDFRMALSLKPETAFRVRQPNDPARLVVVEPGNLLPEDRQWPGTVMASIGLNLRTGPSTQHSVIQKLADQTLLTVLAEFDDWLYVQALQKRGYVSRDFVLRQDQVEQVPPESGFLREREALLRAQPKPPEDQLLKVDPNDSAWTEHVVAYVWNEFGALIMLVSEILSVDPAVAVAVLAIESGGDAFMDDGRMRIRFENHIFFRLHGRLDPERFAQYLRYNIERPWEGHEWRPSPEHEWQPFHGNHVAEWNVFNMARTTFDPHSAKLSISMGVAQIMGFNHDDAGYDSVEEMFVSFRDSANAQVLGFFDFVRSNPVALNALLAGDFYTFAEAYNGGGQAELYASLINDAVQTFNRLREDAQMDHQDDATPAPWLPIPPHNPTVEGMDPALYEAWRNHIIQGFNNNQQMFERILKSFMDPYNATVRMYRVMFFVGLASFVAGVAMSVWTQDFKFALVFAGLTAASFITFFLSRPLRSLEENLNFITWLGVIYNSYWARLVYALNAETVQGDLREITEDFVKQIERLIERNNATREDHGSEKPGHPG